MMMYFDCRKVSKEGYVPKVIIYADDQIICNAYLQWNQCQEITLKQNNCSEIKIVLKMMKEWEVKGESLEPSLSPIEDIEKEIFDIELPLDYLENYALPLEWSFPFDITFKAEEFDRPIMIKLHNQKDSGCFTNSYLSFGNRVRLERKYTDKELKKALYQSVIKTMIHCLVVILAHGTLSWKVFLPIMVGNTTIYKVTMAAASLLLIFTLHPAWPIINSLRITAIKPYQEIQKISEQI